MRLIKFSGTLYSDNKATKEVETYINPMYIQRIEGSLEMNIKTREVVDITTIFLSNGERLDVQETAQNVNSMIFIEFK